MGAETGRPVAKIQKRLDSSSGGGEVFRVGVRPEGGAGGSRGPSAAGCEGVTRVQNDLGFALSYWEEAGGQLGDRFSLEWVEVYMSRLPTSPQRWCPNS